METVVLPNTREVERLSAGLVTDARLVLVDLDGCLISEGRAFPDASDFVEACGDRLWIISNNSSDTADAMSCALAAMGLQVSADRILLAGEQTLHHMRQAEPGRSVAVYAGDRLKAQAQTIGIDAGTRHPDIVLLCRGPGFALAQLEDVAAQCLGGARLWVANTDKTHPRHDGRPVPETGALLAAVRAVIGDVPVDCIGKPHPHMARHVLNRTGVPPEDAVFLGDNTATDGALAKAMGMRFVHVVRKGAA